MVKSLGLYPERALSTAAGGCAQPMTGVAASNANRANDTRCHERAAERRRETAVCERGQAHRMRVSSADEGGIGAWRGRSLVGLGPFIHISLGAGNRPGCVGTRKFQSWRRR